ncbi:MAG: hypothetical protein ACKO01_04325 [Erythrobacter sp.]
MKFEADKRELDEALEALMKKADDLKLPLVAIYISQALDSLRAKEGETQTPPTDVG